MHRPIRTAVGTAAAALLALSLAVAPASADEEEVPHASPHAEAPGQEDRSERTQGGHGTSLESVEDDCYEFNEQRPYRIPNARTVLGVEERFDLFPVPGQPVGTGLGVFIDYVCEGLSIDGSPPRRTLVSMLGLFLRRPATNPGGSAFVLAWHATDNPLLANRLRSLGVDSRYVPQSTSTVTDLGDGVERFQQTVAGGGLDYTRTFQVTRPTADARPSTSALFLYPGTEGDVAITYVNRSQPSVRGTSTQVFAPDSLARQLGVPDRAGFSATHIRGSWVGTYAVRDAAWPAP